MTTRTEANSAHAERSAAILSLLVGILLFVIKFVAYVLTGSAAILSDALEQIVNILAGAFALYAVILAHYPADREHPYGHGKVEFLSAGFEGGMIVLAAVLIAANAVKQLVVGAQLEKINNGLALISVAMVINGALGLFLVRSGRRSGSIALEADGKHLLSDAITSLVVLVALFAVELTGWSFLDPLAAILVAIYIARMALGLLRRSAAGLMDEQDREDDATIRGIIDSHLVPGGKAPQICSYHKLRHRHSGRYHWIDFHIVVPAMLNIEQGHQIASTIEYEIEQALGEGNATAHVEPCHEDKCSNCAAERTRAK